MECNKGISPAGYVNTVDSWLIFDQTHWLFISGAPRMPSTGQYGCQTPGCWKTISVALLFGSWKYFSLGWWNALASAWFPDVRHFENLTPWIQLRLGLRDRAWKPTNGHSRKLAQLSMTIFSKFWSWNHYPICIHGSRSRSFTCIAEQVTSGSCWHVFSGRAELSFREHKRRNGEICPCSCSVSIAMFFY